MPHIQLSDSAYMGFQQRAAAANLSVDEYLNRVGEMTPDPDGFILTPDIEAALEEGLDDIRNGRMVSADEVSQDIKRLSREWRAKRA